MMHVTMESRRSASRLQKQPSLGERRAQSRMEVDWAVKLGGRADGLRYLAGRTCNVSAGGALVQLAIPLEAARLCPGQRVRLGFAGPTGPGVLAAAEMIEATVLRGRDDAGSQEVAVRFDAAVDAFIAGCDRMRAHVQHVQ